MNILNNKIYENLDLLPLDLQGWNGDKPYPNGDIFVKGCFDKSNLYKLVLDGEIKDYEIDENGITVIKEFNLRSVSIVPSMSIRYKE